MYMYNLEIEFVIYHRLLVDIVFAIARSDCLFDCSLIIVFDAMYLFT